MQVNVSILSLENVINPFLFIHPSIRLDQQAELSSLVSEGFVRFFVELVGHYPLHMVESSNGSRELQRDSFRKSHPSRGVRQFLQLFMDTQMFAGFIQDKELCKGGGRGNSDVAVPLVTRAISLKRHEQFFLTRLNVTADRLMGEFLFSITIHWHEIREGKTKLYMHKHFLPLSSNRMKLLFIIKSIGKKINTLPLPFKLILGLIFYNFYYLFFIVI